MDPGRPIARSSDLSMEERFRLYDYLMATPHVIHLDPKYAGGILAPLTKEYPELREEIGTTWVKARPDILISPFHGPINPAITTFVCPGATTWSLAAPNNRDTVERFGTWQDRLLLEYNHPERAGKRWLIESMIDLGSREESRWDTSPGMIATKDAMAKLDRKRVDALKSGDDSDSVKNTLFFTLTMARENLKDLWEARAFDDVKQSI